MEAWLCLGSRSRLCPGAPRPRFAFTIQTTHPSSGRNIWPLLCLSPSSLPADHSCVRLCVQPQGRTCHSNLTHLHESTGSRIGHVACFWPGRCEGGLQDGSQERLSFRTKSKVSGRKKPFAPPPSFLLGYCPMCSCLEPWQSSQSHEAAGL